MTYTGEGGIPDIRNRLPREYGTVILDGSGNATIMFANPAAINPRRFVQLTPWAGPGSAPIVANPVAWVTSGSDYTGVTIKGHLLRPLPSVLVLLSALIGYQVWTNAAGAKVDWQIY